MQQDHFPDIQEVLGAQDPEKLLHKLGAYLAENSRDGARLDVLTEPEKTVYLSYIFQREISNGSFFYYFNSPYADHAPETAEALRQIQAFQAEQMLLKAMRLFPAQVLPTAAQRQDFLLTLEGGNVERKLAKLDDQYLKIQDDIAGQCYGYINAYLADFSW